MKKITINSRIRAVDIYLIVSITLLFALNVSGQVRVNFNPRTPISNPSTTIHHVKGDFSLIGNTNLTLNSYDNSYNNSNNSMRYVDVDGDSNTFNSSSATLTYSNENGANPNCTNVVFAGLYWTGRASNDSSSPTIFNVTKNSVTKTFDKRKVSLKGPNSSTYTTITAGQNDIYFPTSSDAFMYSAYADITTYVKNNGLGQYTVADIALVEGNGGGTGYYGGWGIIVVYENSKMKWRDITVFDGHAYVEGNTTINHQIPISGFNAVQTGQVNVKLGLMAGEGDVGISGDYFNILKSSTNTWEPLTHSGNVVNNFFNSSIQTGSNPRNPNIQNNTGLDISMFNIPNPGNTIISNNQTSTTLNYGSTQDTYVIFMAALAVDAYIPDAEGVMSLITINGQPANGGLTVLPGEELEYSIKILNEGTEPVANTKVAIEIPYPTTFVNGSESGTINFMPLPSPNNLFFNPTLGGNGTLIWNIGTLPVPSNPSDVLGELKFKIKVTEDCFILSNPNCTPNIPLYGYLSGMGAITGIVFNDKPFIQGYQTTGVCLGDPITDPIIVNINSTNYIDQNCQNTNTTLAFTFCNTNSPIPVTNISTNYPNGTLFYSSYPVTNSTIQYNTSNPFPSTIGISTYYAVPPNANGCYYTFTITIIVNPTVAMTSLTNVDGCNVNAIQPLLYSETPVSISLQEFINAGGSVSNANLTYTITYQDSQTGSCPIKITRKFNVITNCSNNELIQTINVQDNAAPVIAALPATSTINCPDVPVFTVATASDNCGSDFTLTFNDATTNGGCFGSYSITRTWTATDACGNFSTASQTINVQDNTAPVIAALPSVSTINCPDVPVFTVATASDNCGSDFTLTFIDVTTNGGCFGSYSITRTWTATDACGNFSTASQTINVQDNAAPVIAALPATSTINCPDLPVFTVATASDNCGSDFTLTFNDATTNGDCAGSYSITRTWTATDACGNFSSASQTINVQDNSAPVIAALPSVSTINCTDVPVFAVATASDNCGSDFTLTFIDVITNGGCAGSYSITRNWTATDACGNFSTASQTINVQDMSAPVIAALPSVSTINCTDVPVFTVATASDNCGSDFTLTFIDVITNGGCAGSYSITRNWTATDACGNFSTASQNINVQDNSAPYFTSELPNDISVSCDDTPSPAIITAADNCDSNVAIVVNDVINHNEGNCTGNYSISRTWTITDDCGNSINHTQTITVYDSAPPLLTTPYNEDVSVVCSNIPEVPNLEFSDNCSSVANANFTETTTGISNYGYVIIREWIVSDNCGNSDTFVQTINVTVENPYDGIVYSICTGENPIDLFTILGSSIPTTGEWIDSSETGGLNGNIFNPLNIPVGNYTLQYIVTTENDVCPMLFEVYLNINDDCVVLPACDITIYNAVSPNNDGLNDFFFIDGLECYPKNTVEIYNKWGILVYETESYDNNTRAFKGQSEGRSTLNKNEGLPDGTYYYILKYVDAENKTHDKAGYLYVSK